MQIKKRLFGAITAVALAFSFSASGTLPLTTSSAEGTLKALEITQEMAIGWNIGNSLDAASSPGLSQETSWGNPKITQELIDAVKAKGFNTIRVPTTWYNNTTISTDADGSTVYTINADWLARVKEVVDYAYQQDMYVILNLHHEEWINRPDFPDAYEEMSPRLIQMWQQIAAYFKDYGQRLIFEGMNEPRQTDVSYEWQGDAACYEVVNQLNADFVHTVRSVESPYQDTRLLMIPSYAASAYSSIYAALEVPDDPYVAVSLHAYTPYDFAMGDGDHTQFNNKNQSDLDALFSDIQYYFTDRDIPVVMGEFGASNYNNTEARCDWATYYLTWTKKIGIPCVLWDNNAITNSTSASEAHGYLDRSSNTWYEASEPVVDAMMTVMKDESIVWGSERYLPTWIHQDIQSGTSLYESENGQSLIANDANGGNCTSPVDVSTELINEDREIAIRYSGMTAPILALTNDQWGDWTEISAYDIDEKNGIAYYSYENIANAWGDVSTAAHLFVRAGSDMTIYQIASIQSAVLAEEETTPPEEPLPYYLGDVNLDAQVDITDAVVLLKYLLQIDNTTISADAYDHTADVNEDGTVNGADCNALRHLLIAAS